MQIFWQSENVHVFEDVKNYHNNLSVYSVQ